ncbi:MAG: formate dehydrogenase [Gemmatimonadota bacterium]|nr:MAG: formate dehydrogenase [Gemmatimonadota bacterium]
MRSAWTRLLAALTPWKVVGLVFLVSGAYATVLRFTRGLGGSTNLSDTFPWGMWVGFDILCGVGLAAGGFTVSAMVYILRLEKYRPLARPAVLTAFIGYLMVVGGLMFDLGHPWRIWHPMVMWNPHSVMFEIAWCVTLYSSVLALEVSAMVFEKLRWARTTRVVHAATFPLTVCAVLLSMLHQSSLGSMFLIVPGRLHELWYTPILPLLFFISAMGVGLAMTIMESTLSSRTFGRASELEILAPVGRLASIVFGLYLVIRLADMFRSGALTSIWPVDRASAYFLLEIALLAAPVVLFNTVRVARNARWLYHTAQVAVLGFVVSRLNVAVTGFEVVAGESYVPYWTEVAVTGMLVTVGVIGFYLAARYLPVFEPDELEHAREQSWQEERERHAAFARAGKAGAAPVETAGG